MRNDTATASAVLALTGGPADVRHVTHCLTRLRLTLADPAAVDEASLRALPGVLGVIGAGTPSVQVVLGPGVVDTVTAEVERQLAAGAGALEAGNRSEPASRKGPLAAALRRIANVFVPLIPPSSATRARPRPSPSTRAAS